MPNIIKAYRCYICGELFPKDNGYSIAKKHVKGWFGDKEDHDIAFCTVCAEKMVLFVKRQRCGEVGESE